MSADRGHHDGAGGRRHREGKDREHHDQGTPPEAGMAPALAQWVARGPQRVAAASSPVHPSAVPAVERAGLSTLNEGQTVEYELVTNRGKTSAENLKVS